MQPEIVRVRMPKDKEVLGILDQRLGGSRTHVRCLDGKTRNCRIPGRLKKRLWVRPGDTVLVEPWEFGGDEKGDIIYKYKPNQVAVLRKKGMLESLEDFEEF
ncbi:translation initiation factor eIF-1A [Candidatus Woesearchaeota archaeon]|nr:translation initiation factor eIF-1A [Candidatus Woesearchaeota archaeon]